MAQVERVMPPHDPPYHKRGVRDLYARGTWAYALGKPAWTHPKYKRAVALARRIGFNPWWIRNWSDVAAVLDGCYMDEREGVHKANFFSLLRQFEGEHDGQPLHLMDWMRFDVTIPLFGWMRPNGTRRFRRGHIEIPKKNAKTTTAAGYVLLLTGFDDEPGAEVYTAAVDRTQARKMYRSAYEMGRRSPEIKNELEFIPSRHRIVHLASASFYEALSAEVASKEGLNIHGLVEDELHVYPNRAMHDTLKHGGAARRQPLFFAITTAGVYDPTSIGWEQHDYARRVTHAMNGAEQDWTFFGYMTGLTPNEEPMFHEPAMAVKANPAIGVSVHTEEIADIVREAMQKPSELPNVKRYRFNCWTQAIEAWMPMDKWDACAAEYSEFGLEGLTCYAGIDCSLSQDISALVLYFPPQGEIKNARVLAWFWVPSGVVTKRDEEYNGWYSQWIKNGYMLTTPGDTIDQEHIRAHLNELRGRFAIRTVAYDHAFAQKLAQDIESDGFDIGAFGQGFNAMNEPTNALLEMVLGREIEHPNHPVLNWHISNAQAVQDGGGRNRLVKTWGSGRQGRARIRFKIDGAIALVMALGTSRLDDMGITRAEELIR